jgi:hypothetical protein
LPTRTGRGGRILYAEVYPSLTPPRGGHSIKDADQVQALARHFAELEATGKLSACFAVDLPQPDREEVEREEGWILAPRRSRKPAWRGDKISLFYK